MKILYISQGQFNDYQCDMLLHGLRMLLGADVVDVQRIRAMYAASGPGSYTVWGLLPDDKDVDRTDISGKIARRYFDLIIYGSAHWDLSFLDEVTSVYLPSRVAFVDGLDDERVLSSLAGKGVYFRREASGSPMPRHPIQFAIPKEKIVSNFDIPKKIRLMSQLDPRDRSTYIYLTESWYYQQYGESYFGYTMRKGGWDCLRHYEIMAAGALPYFEELENCPLTTMEHFPRNEMYQARQLRDHWLDSSASQYWELLSKVRTVLVEKLTTEALAKRVLDKMMS